MCLFMSLTNLLAISISPICSVKCPPLFNRPGNEATPLTLAIEVELLDAAAVVGGALAAGARLK